MENATIRCKEKFAFLHVAQPSKKNATVSGQHAYNYNVSHIWHYAILTLSYKSKRWFGRFAESHFHQGEALVGVYHLLCRLCTKPLSKYRYPIVLIVFLNLG